MPLNARHAQLFAQYVEELKNVKKFADLWWDSLIETEAQTTEDHEEAVQRVQRRWRAGPAAHPRVIAVIRKYYFECERLNEEISEAVEQDSEDLESEEPHRLPGEEDYEDEDDEDEDDEGDDNEDDEVINPSVFLGEFLVSPETEALAEFVSTLTYWPIGMDLEGNLV